MNTYANGGRTAGGPLDAPVAVSGGVCSGTGVQPRKIDGIIGASKAYIRRVGAGPFPSEIEGEVGDAIRKAGNEFGSVTGRPRRCGWFDVPLLRYTAVINGFDSLIITKLDVPDGLEEIPVCVGYKVDGVEVTKMPGWKGATKGVSQLCWHGGAGCDAYGRHGLLARS